MKILKGQFTHTVLKLMRPENSSPGWCRFQALESGVDQRQESGRCSLTFSSQCFTPWFLQHSSVLLVWSGLVRPDVLSSFCRGFHITFTMLLACSPSPPAAPPPLQPLPHLPSLSEPAAVPSACRSGGDLIKAGGGSLANGPSQ